MGLFKRNRGKDSVVKLSYILALIGGIVMMILLSLAAILNFAVNIPFNSLLLSYFGTGVLLDGIVGLISG